MPNNLFSDSDNVIPRRLTPEVLQALRAVRFIAQHIKDADKDNEVSISHNEVSIYVDHTKAKVCLRNETVLFTPFLNKIWSKETPYVYFSFICAKKMYAFLYQHL